MVLRLAARWAIAKSLSWSEATVQMMQLKPELEVDWRLAMLEGWVRVDTFSCGVMESQIGNQFSLLLGADLKSWHRSREDYYNSGGLDWEMVSRTKLRMRKFPTTNFGNPAWLISNPLWHHHQVCFPALRIDPCACRADSNHPSVILLVRLCACILQIHHEGPCSRAW